MDLFPKDPKKIRERIRRYERQLRQERAENEYFGDGYGKRYWLGPLYMLLGDTEGALTSFAWFEETFPGDSGHPMQLLCWTLALYRSGQIEAAIQKLRQTIASNRYLIPHLLGLEQHDLDITLGKHVNEIFQFEDTPPEIFSLWDNTERQWAKTIYPKSER
jgi:tetratricopeptide (TPR) repeat protein